MRHIEIDMKYILVERIKEELGDDGKEFEDPFGDFPD